MKILNYEIISTIFIWILGTVLHFTYELSNNNIFVGFFSAVNESTWEHLKLIFFPMLISTIIGFFYFKNEYKNYLCTKTLGLLLAIFITISIFYTYTGIIGTNFAIIDISLFFFSTLAGQIYSYKKLKSNTKCNKIIYFSILILLLICFIIFTTNPPNINLFLDPVTNTFGI